MDIYGRLTQGYRVRERVARNWLEASLDNLTFRKVRCPEGADHDAVTITLFKDAAQRVCGWFIGPVRMSATGVDMPYLPPSRRTLAAVAVIRAVGAAKAAGLPVCVVDPEDLWAPVWQV